MSFLLKTPILCLITDGSITNQSALSGGFGSALQLIETAVSAKISLVQIREKQLSARLLYKLTEQAAKIIKGSETQLLLNDRADIAFAAGADGVHLTTVSLYTSVVRKNFPKDFIIGVSTHSLTEAQTAQKEGADFAVLGPIFDTPSKRIYGNPISLEKLKEVSETLSPFPIVAIGGINMDNVKEVFENGASGIAAIRLLNDAAKLHDVVQSIKRQSGVWSLES